MQYFTLICLCKLLKVSVILFFYRNLNDSKIPVNDYTKTALSRKYNYNTYMKTKKVK